MDIDEALAKYDLFDTQALMDELARDRTFFDGQAFLVLVHQPATEQQILAVRRLPPIAVDQSYNREMWDWLSDQVRGLDMPPRSDTSASTLVTVLCRRGTNGWGPLERAWAMAWRYSNHNSDAFDRDIIVVTEHGWCSLWSEAGGYSPALKVEAPFGGGF